MGLFDRFKRPPLAQKSYRLQELLPGVSWTPKWTEFSAQRAIKDGFKRSTWVYACCRLRANNIAAIPWIVEVRRGDNWEAAPNHPLQQLIDRPNDGYDWPSMVRTWMYWLDLSGDAWGTKVRNGAGRITELWPILPDQMDVLPGTEQLVRAYRYRRAMISREIPSQDILHLRYSNPGDAYFGLAPLQAAARAVDIDEEAEKWQKVSLQNMAVPPGAFVLEGDVTQTQYDETKRWVKEQSGPEHAREAWVLANVKWQQMAQSAVDLDFSGGRRLVREEICSAFSVPPPLVGIYENATLANIETARTILWREGLIPVLDELAGQLNLSLAAEYPDRPRIRYDITNVEALQENYTEKVNNARTLFALGVPMSEINQMLELGIDTDTMPNADIGYVSPGLIPSDMDIEMPPLPGSTALARQVDDT
jgi:HK97 family phage portal protein